MLTFSLTMVIIKDFFSDAGTLTDFAVITEVLIK
jgi:hypothetical protein